MTKTVLYIIITLLSVIACKKDNPNTTSNSSSTFNIQYQVVGFTACNTYQGIKVCLYKTYNDYYSNQNVIATGFTNANGECVFLNVPVYNYYYNFSVQCNGTVGGNSTSNQLTGFIAPNTTYVQDVQDVSMGYL